MKNFIEKMLEYGAALDQTTSETKENKIINDAEIFYKNHLAESSLLKIHSINHLLIAWEQYKKSNWWESESIDVEKVLMKQFLDSNNIIELTPLLEKTLPIAVVNHRIYTLEFIEWIGENYIRLNKVWVHRYNSQTDKDNWRTTEWVYDYWKSQYGG